MKGTVQKVGAAEADLADTLRNSEKDRAENLMIVDLMRNDLGRLAEVGTVKVEELFGIESYPTLLQMVSTISAQIPALSLHTILSALFPCGSVTGAPKIRAMEIIHELERRSRGLYTGSIGHLRPTAGQIAGSGHLGVSRASAMATTSRGRAMSSGHGGWSVSVASAFCSMRAREKSRGWYRPVAQSETKSL